MGSAGKVFTQPLLVLLVIAIASWLLSTREQRSSGRKARLLRAVVLGSLVLLWILSLPVTATFLESTLLLVPTEPQEPVDVVVILAGGFARPLNPEVLSIDSTLRVVDGVEWWKRFPRSTLVMSGGSYSRPDNGSRSETKLMRDIAVANGVPASKIVLEPESRNTRGHPVEVLQLPGMSRETRVGVVTSRWHLRRATIEFRRHFDVVVPLPNPPPSHSLNWGSFIPSAVALDSTTTMIHEWLGIAWYRLLAA